MERGNPHYAPIMALSACENDINFFTLYYTYTVIHPNFLTNVLRLNIEPS